MKLNRELLSKYFIKKLRKITHFIGKVTLSLIPYYNEKMELNFKTSWSLYR